MRCCRCKGRARVRCNPTRRELPRHSPLLSNRLVTPLAGTAGVDEVATCATDLNAVITRGSLAFRANQRTNAIGYDADGVECLKAGNLGVEAGFGVFVEKLKRVLGAVTPIAVYLP
jgi:hypothetical protein